MKLQFLGAAGQVTGSCYLLQVGRSRMMIDCGLFQERQFQSRNWEPLPVPAHSIDAVLLTHAHLDHCGLLPKLVAEGFRGPIYTTGASRDLAKIILVDAGEIQEEDAAFKKRRHAREGRRGRHPELPLYTARQAQKVFRRFKIVPYRTPVSFNSDIRATFHDAGHILGSAMIELHIRDAGAERTLLFSGDIGQWGRAIVRDPSLFERADYVVMESTYGNRNHEECGPVADQLAEVINQTVEAGGNVIIPTFAVERAQEVMYHISRLVYADRIPHLLGFLDSPVAVEATRVFRKHRECMDEEAQAVLRQDERLFQYPGFKLVSSVDESKAINRIRGSCIIMAGSGMCTAGRIKHHLVRNLDRAECTVLFVGYQAGGTLGRQILDGAGEVRIHGHQHKVRAKIARIDGLSAHADRGELLRWIGHLKQPPRSVFLTHGEPAAAAALAEAIRRDFSFQVEIPEYQQEIGLG